MPDNLNENINKIITNQSNITKNYNVSQINKSKSSYNLTLVNNNISNIKKLNDALSDIQSSISNPKYVLDNIYLLNLDFEKELNFISDTKKLLVYETIIEDSFKQNSYLELIESILYKFDNIKTSYYILKETYEIIDENDNILDTFYFNILSKGFIFYNIHIFKNSYFFNAPKDINYLKIKLYLERISHSNTVKFNLKLTSEYQSNYICLKYLKYNNSI